MRQLPQTAEPDPFTDRYEADLCRGLGLSGESREFFARGRLGWLAVCLRARAHAAERFLDYGCGTGLAAALVRELLAVREYVGVDVSAEALAAARERHGGSAVSFIEIGCFQPAGDFDVVYCNGVFHHVPPGQRPAAVRTIRDALRPGGLFALWENNPWSLSARWVMARIPFDREARMVDPAAARRLLRTAGFEIVSTHYLFIFPRFLSAARRLERSLARWPLGAQYQVLARRPAAESRAGVGA